MRYISKYSWTRYNFNFGKLNSNIFNEPWSGGVVLLLSVVVAMILANVPATAEIYHKVLSTDLSVYLQSKNGGLSVAFPRGMTVETFINDALMMIFFFGVGLEIKREVMHGQLATPRKALLPVIAALGGMVAPALIYAVINNGTPAAAGWGIPTATDIAFAIGILTLLGDRVPVSLKIFLTALAIADDLGAIIVIALFYGGAINWTLLGIACAIMVWVYVLNTIGEKKPLWYVIFALVIWSLFYYSGVHATLSGVIMALLIPSRPRYEKSYFNRRSHILRREISKRIELLEEQDNDGHNDEELHLKLHEMSSLARGSVSLSHRFESMLSPYITFLIMPIFALANAGVTINPEYLNIFVPPAGCGHIGLGVFLGLVLGKPLGITIFSFLAVKLGVASMPEGASWRMLFAVACFGGIGFTMSIFVDTLAFGSVGVDFIDQGKIAILMGSLSAALFGTLMVLLFSKDTKNEAVN